MPVLDVSACFLDVGEDRAQPRWFVCEVQVSRQHLHGKIIGGIAHQGGAAVAVSGSLTGRANRRRLVSHRERSGSSALRRAGVLRRRRVTGGGWHACRGWHVAEVQRIRRTALGSMLAGAVIGAVLAILAAAAWPASIGPLAYAAIVVVGSVGGSALGVLAVSVSKNR
jgi:hypothetical protein